MIVIIVILLLLDIRNWIVLCNLQTGVREELHSIQEKFNKELHSMDIKIRNISDVLEEPEIVAYASAEELEEVKQRIEQMESADFPALDDKLSEGLQNLVNYSVGIARGGSGIG